MKDLIIVLYHFQDESKTWEDDAVDDYSTKKVLLNPLSAC